VSAASTAFSVEGDDEQVAASTDGSSREHQPDTQPVEVGLPVTATEGALPPRDQRPSAAQLGDAGDEAAAVGILGAVLAASFLVELVGAVFIWPDWVVQLSIFERYGSPFTKGLAWLNVLGLLAVAVVALGIATWRFAQKDSGV